MIISNYDATYLDCGFGGWVNTGNNWCSPYKEWQLQHGNDPYRLLEMRGVNNLEEAKRNVMGGEVAMWTETSDGHTMMTRYETNKSGMIKRECISGLSLERQLTLRGCGEAPPLEAGSRLSGGW